MRRHHIQEVETRSLICVKVENERSVLMCRVFCHSRLPPFVICVFLDQLGCFFPPNFILQHFQVNKYKFQCGLCVVEIRA